MMPMEARRVLLHIGAPKCGSTYLQRVMLRNAATLEASGIRYPHDGSHHPGNAANLGAIDSEALDRHFSGGIHTLIYSHEDLFSAPRQGAALARLAAISGTRLQIIAFLRPFSEIVFGDYSQFMKQHFESYLAARKAYDGQDFETFVEARRRVLTPVSFLDRWQALTPDLPLRLTHHRKIRAVMEDLIGADVRLDWKVPPSEVNPSLRMEDCDRLVELLHDPSADDGLIRDEFKSAFRRTGEPDAGRSTARAALIEARFASEIKGLKKAFGFDNRPQPPAG